MINDLPLEKSSFFYERRRRLDRHIKERAKRKKTLFLMISLGLIITSSFFISYKAYVHSNSRNLQYAVEHSFTTGFSSKDKLLGVQNMSLIYYDGETAVVEATGLSKAAPHRTISIKGSFKKDKDNSWYLEKFMSS